MPPVFRFAPSPNGYLHLGHARSAVLNFDLARDRGGRLLLRIEDIDTTRCRLEYETAIIEDLSWLGLTWEQLVRRQSEHFALYSEALDELDRDGLIYRSFTSRAEIAQAVAAKESHATWPRDPDGAPLYPGHAGELSRAAQEKRAAEGEPFALRLNMAEAIRRTGPLTWTEQGTGPDGETGTVIAQPEAWGDVVLGRKEMPASYHLAVVLDDALQGVTDVVRGQDLFWATSIHRLLQTLLGLPQPVYQHHALIRDEAGAKLSKSNRATAICELRALGLSPAAVRRMASA